MWSREVDERHVSLGTIFRLVCIFNLGHRQIYKFVLMFVELSWYKISLSLIYSAMAFHGGEARAALVAKDRRRPLQYTEK
jgi:uncharacterized membrane protein